MITSLNLSVLPRHEQEVHIFLHKMYTILQAKSKTLFTWAGQQQIDVLCLIETFCTENQVLVI